MRIKIDNKRALYRRAVLTTVDEEGREQYYHKWVKVSHLRLNTRHTNTTPWVHFTDEEAINGGWDGGRLVFDVNTQKLLTEAEAEVINSDR